MDSAPETALAFSAVAPWERPGFAAHAIQYPEFPTPNIASQRPALRIVEALGDPNYRRLVPVIPAASDPGTRTLWCSYYLDFKIMMELGPER